jgi:hypothetical protein
MTVGVASILGAPKLSVMHGLLTKAQDIPGDTAEFGVYYGGTSQFIHLALPDKKHHMFDTFRGLPPADASIDLHKEGEFCSRLDDVVKVMGDLATVSLHVGTFPNSLKSVYGYKKLRFSFVHIDFDLYEGTLEALKYTYERMSPGGVMVFDDWMWPNTPGVTRAIDEFFYGKPETIQSLERYQAFIIKGA